MRKTLLALAAMMLLPSLAMAEEAKKMTIVETAVAAKFNTLVAAVKAAGLVDALSGDGPLTVFAPTDEAFAKLPAGTVENLLKPENKDQLVAVLTYHVVKGNMTAGKVLKKKSLETLQGGSIAVSTDDKGAKVNDSRILKTDISCSNGVVHVIDTVLLPKK
ncbi:MAG: fasciclin domain-containing protein [Rubripirellula sp.]|jgi:uncharacterized surface protein with fasciclin (FAS1) repeats|nr:fasciclin domain-containing protein [Rubripirellula sp.]MDA9777340.1 fasciclin domain-containing protein [Rubripirellula sp.]